ncbi:MAG: hypothetical protein MMC33_008705 [Icmadophila ericetorum]|nr:hypothetical protein [Icmadophila ericetorum]
MDVSPALESPRDEYQLLSSAKSITIPTLLSSLLSNPTPPSGTKSTSSSTICAPSILFLPLEPANDASYLGLPYFTPEEVRLLKSTVIAPTTSAVHANKNNTNNKKKQRPIKNRSKPIDDGNKDSTAQELPTSFEEPQTQTLE